MTASPLPAPAKSCLIVPDSVRAWHADLLRSGQMTPDAVQSQAVGLLQNLADSLVAPPEQNGGILAGLARKLRPDKNPPPAPAGLYLHGGVGRGKSFLMDGFFLNARCEKKMRAHFHQFMRRFHADMKAREGQSDPLAQVADNLARKYDLVCFDEFHVSDIADAMILGRMLRRMLDGGARFVMTSNYAPDELYPNGLARDRFLPAIALLNERLQVFPLEGDADYRMRALSQAPAYFESPASGGENPQMRAAYERLACGMNLPPQIKIAGRAVPAVARASDVIWFRFADLCGGARAQADYLRLAERYAALFLSEVPKLDSADPEAARRFTWLVDILYDAGVRLILGAQTPLEKLYGESEGGESGRTFSRLVEMGSREYLARGARETYSANSTP